MLLDLRFALRMIRVHPWFSAAVVAALALGIGANTAVFTLVNAVMFKPLPFRGGDRIVAIYHSNRELGEDRVSISYPDYLEYKAQSTAFESLEAVWNAGVALSDQGNPPEPYQMARVTPGFLDMLGVQPIQGRGFRAEDATPGADRPLLISYGVWRDRYGQAPDVVGRTVSIGEEPFTITGIMPEGFGFPNRHDLWTPLVDEPEAHQRSRRNLMLIGVRKPGVSIGQANADLSVIAKRLAAEYPEDRGIGATAMTFHDLQNNGPIRLVFLLMQGAVGFVLLIACANIANMMLSRSLGRTREMAVRASMGASRWQMLRQLLVESLLLSFLGGAVGLGLSYYAIRAFDAAVANVGKPSWILFEMDYPVFVYFAAVCLVSGLLFGLAPGLESSRVDLNATLKDGLRSSTSKRGGIISGVLVTGQFTMALVLLAGAGIFLRGLVVQRAIADRLPQDRVLTARIQLPPDRYADDGSRFRFYDDLLTGLRAAPGVQQAEIVSVPPGDGAEVDQYQLEGEPEAEAAARPHALRLAASPGYLALLDVPILTGRAFDDRDGFAGRDSIIVTSDFAARVWPGQPPLGKRLRFYPPPPPPGAAAASPGPPGPWMTVVGVSGDLEQRPREANPEPLLFVPYAPGGRATMTVLLRTQGDPAALAGPLRSELQRLDPDRALADVMTLAERASSQRWPLRVFGTIFLIFAGGALLMASIGIYAVVAQATARRTQEIGIRMALGATPRNILRLVIGRGLLELAIGVVLGLAVGLAVTFQMGELLFGASPTDPVVFGGAILILSSVGLAASWFPARRAARLQPVTALREG